MADFDEKLNQILSNPDAMAQIARLAQSLNGSPEASASGTESGVPPPDASGTADGLPRKVSGAANGLTRNVSGAADAFPPDASGPSAPFEAVPDDGNSIAQFLPLLQELGGDSDARRLLYALRPYLRPQKQEKVERALHLARLFRVGKKFLSQWEG